MENEILVDDQTVHTDSHDWACLLDHRKERKRNTIIQMIMNLRV